MKKEGFIAHDITIDNDDLIRYCVQRNLINNGKTRAEYVSQLPLTEKKKK